MLNDDTIDKEMFEMISDKEQVTEAVNKGVDIRKNKSGLKSVMRKLLKKGKK
jgi:hypothetical protein